MPMKILHLLSFLSPFLFYVVHGVNALPLLEKSGIEAIYQFGDSIADTGNIKHENPLFRSGKFPYGETFFHYPTGRCSNGLLIVDFFAQALDLPLLDPYLNKEGNFTHGVNFAVAGATALDLLTLATKNIYPTVTNSSLLVQLDWFKSHLDTICTTPSESKKKLGKALFFVGEIGGNDYNYASEESIAVDELRTLVPEIIQTIMNVVKGIFF